MANLIHDPLTQFIAQAVVIIACSRLVGLLARRMNQPMVIAEVVAGILLGPSLLGFVMPELMNGLFPSSSMGLLGTLSQAGLLVFMFLVGLELDPKLLRGRGRASVLISHTSIIVPFVLGSLLAFELYPTLAPEGVAFSSFAMFMGVSMSITAFPVLARILTERRLLRTRVGAVTITCAAVDDVTAWCLLAFVVSLVRATGLSDAVQTTVFACAFIAVMFVVVQPLLRRIAARVDSSEGLTQNLVALVFVLLLISSWTTEIIGIHALFGAFMLGAMLPKTGGLGHALAERVEDFAVVFLLPLFFAYSGLRTEIGLLDSSDAWMTCGSIILVACIGKFGGSAIPARLTGLAWRESVAVGILMNTRGLMELIVLNIGLDIGVISPKLFTMMVIMALVTTFMTTPILNRVYPAERIASDLLETETPLGKPAELPGLKVLMCISRASSGRSMPVLAAALSDPSARSRESFFAVKLMDSIERTSTYLKGEPDDAEQPMQTLVDTGRELGLDVHPMSFVSTHPAQDICEIASVKAVDLLLLGWHKPLITSATLGGTVDEVLRRANANVGVFVDRGLKQVRRVLVPYFGSPHDRAAVALASRLVARAGVDVIILHVVRPAGTERIGPSAQEKLGFVFEEIGQQRNRVLVKLVEAKDTADAAVQESANGYDLVVVGLGSEWGLEQRLFGLMPERLVSRCPVSMLLVRAHGDPTALRPHNAPVVTDTSTHDVGT